MARSLVARTERRLPSTSADPSTSETDRIVNVDALEDRHFEPPAGFDREDYFEGRFGALASGDAHTVRLRVEGDKSAYFRRKCYHPTQTIRPAEDGEAIVVTFEVQGLDEIAAFIRSWGAAVRSWTRLHWPSGSRRRRRPWRISMRGSIEFESYTFCSPDAPTCPLRRDPCVGVMLGSRVRATGGWGVGTMGSPYVASCFVMHRCAPSDNQLLSASPIS